MSSIEKMGEFFNKRANGYDEHMLGDESDLIYYRKIADPIKETNQIISVLDLGIGTGIELEGIFNKAPNALITGIDMSEKMLEFLKTKYPEKVKQFSLQLGSYLTIPFAENKYDYVISSMTLHHYTEDVKTDLYKKIRQAIKDGGVYIEGDYIVSKEDEKMLIKENYLKLKEVDNIDLYHIDIPFSIETQTRIFLNAGFTDIKVIFQKKNAAIFVAEK